MRSMYEQRKIKKATPVMLSEAKHLSNDRRPFEGPSLSLGMTEGGGLRDALDVRAAKD